MSSGAMLFASIRKSDGSDGVRHPQQPTGNSALCALPLILKRNDFVG